MARFLLAILALFVCLSALGCEAVAPYLRSDVSYENQKRQIQRYDPYPDNDMAPAMVGVRPRDFDTPVPEAVRANWSARNAPLRPAL